MYAERIARIKAAINSGRTDLAQMILSDFLLTPQGNLDESARDALVASIPGSKVVFGGSGLGFRAGYLQVDGEKYYFA